MTALKRFRCIRVILITIALLTTIAWSTYIHVGTPPIITTGPTHNTIDSYTSQWKVIIKDILQHAQTIPCNQYQYSPVHIDTSPEQLFYALLEASKQNLHNAIRYLVHCGATVNGRINHPHGHTPLMAAALHGQCTVVKMLLDYGAEVNAQNQAGETALMKAAGDTFCSVQKATTVVRLLLQRGADATLVDNQGNSALHCALTKQSDDNCRIAQLLYQMDAADLTMHNTRGISLLEHPALLNKKNAIMWLVTHGAHLNNPETLESPLLYTYASIVSKAYYRTLQRPLPLQTYIELIDELTQRGGYLSPKQLATLHPRICARINKAFKTRKQVLQANILDYKDVPLAAHNVPVELYQLTRQFSGDHTDV